MKYFFVITGPSACGKTTLLQYGSNFKIWRWADKYSTRPRREGNQFDDIVEQLSTQEIYESRRLDFRYIMNGNIYAFSSEEILSELKKSENDCGDDCHTGHIAIICSDLRTIKKLQKHSELSKHLIVLFVSSVSNIQQVTKAWLKREQETYTFNSKETQIEKNFNVLNDCIESMKTELVGSYFEKEEGKTNFIEFSTKFQNLYAEYIKVMPKSNSYMQRIRNIDKFYYKYIEEIGDFDYTILNFFNIADDDVNSQQMTLQVKSILKYLDKNPDKTPYYRRESRTRDKNQKYLFFICAPKMSGKAILFSNLNLLSKDKISIIRKMAFRINKNQQSDLARNKGDGYGLSETYWMFKNEKQYNEFISKKESSEFDTYFQKKLKAASNRIRELICESIRERLAKDSKNTHIYNKQLLEEETREYDFTKWWWNFQGTYYAIDTKELYADKHSIIISNMDQLEKASKIAVDCKKILVPIFLVFVDYKEHTKTYYKELTTSQDAEEKTNKVFKTIDDYFEHIGEFRHVILNTGIPEDVHDQISNILNLYIE